MVKEDCLIRIMEILNGNFFAEHVAEDVFRFFLELNIKVEERQEIIKVFHKSLEKQGLQQILDSKMRYAIKLMLYPSILEYEELYKLYTLFDSIFYMKNLELPYTDLLFVEFEVLQQEFVKNKERKRLKLVANDMYRDWKKGMWWYQWR